MSYTAHLYTDAEASVRHSFQLLLKVVLSQVDSTNLQPFQQQALACMECGLTHITPAVRVDTLKVLDLYSSLHPSMFCGAVFKFLELLVSVLASQICIQKVNTRASHKKMSVDTSHYPERLQILNQLVRFLEAVVRPSSCSKQGNDTAATSVPALCVREGKISADSQLTQASLDTISQFFTAGSGQSHLMVLDHYGLLPTEDNIWEELSSCSSAYEDRNKGKFGCNGSALSQELRSMEPSFVRSKMVPLLLECWIDSVPEPSAGNISPHAVETLEQVLHILVLLVRMALLHQKSLSTSSHAQQEGGCLMVELWKEYGNQFAKHFLLLFPHSKFVPSLLTRPHASKPETLSALLSLDTYICEFILTLLAIAEGSRLKDRIFSPLLAFVNEILSKVPHTHTAPGNATVIATSVNTVCNLLDLISGPLKLGMDISLPVLSCALQFYRSTHPQSSARAALNTAFTQLMKSIRNNGHIDTR